MQYIKIYLDALDMTLEELRGKFVLDVGSGYGNFAKECYEYKIAEVVSLDIDPRVFAFDLGAMGRTTRPVFRELPGIIATAAALPFRNEVFDLVTAHFSVPIFAKTRQEVFLLLDEMVRVLKERGDIRIVPYHISDDHDASIWTEEKLKLLKSERNCRIYKDTSKVAEAAFPGRIKLNRYCIITKK